MLPKKYRINTSRDILNCLQSGTFVHGSYLYLKYIHKEGLENTDTQFGIVLSKKKIKHAVDRNRIKRLVYKIIYDLYPCLTPGYQGVFLIHSGIVEAQASQVAYQIQSLLIKANILPKRI